VLNVELNTITPTLTLKVSLSENNNKKNYQVIFILIDILLSSM
jgi:hypothetical protein